jgi:hypothetical protein
VTNKKKAGARYLDWRFPNHFRSNIKQDMLTLQKFNDRGYFVGSSTNTFDQHLKVNAIIVFDLSMINLEL